MSREKVELGRKIDELSEKFRAELARRDGEHEIEVAKREALGIEPLAKDVEEDARAMFALGKPEFARRALSRHLEAAKAKKAALGAAVKVQGDAPKPEDTKRAELSRAQAQGAALAAGKRFSEVPADAGK